MCEMGRKGVDITKDTDMRDEAFIAADIAAKKKQPAGKCEKVFVYWWSLSIKYFMPAALVWIFFLGMKNDIDNAYGGYEGHW